MQQPELDHSIEAQFLPRLPPSALEDGGLLARFVETHDYPGIQAKGSAKIDNTVIPVKLDISTGDVITPGAIEYAYPLMFEDRSLRLQTYNLETVLAEKLISLAEHGVGNTRMRDYYDIHVLSRTFRERIDPKTLADALAATARQRHVEGSAGTIQRLLPEMADSPELQALWQNYGKGAAYARDVTWTDVLGSAAAVLDFAGLARSMPAGR
ncbi:MAG: nucleotidyl transferase AbiEii/AbiGii toxin family protein [Clostridia bacterium]|nr:nucleotidyl transferase AbiEii/AbiGii toxin family protein [Clostridia bacterium]